MMLLWACFLRLTSFTVATKPHVFHGEIVDPHQYPWVVKVSRQGLLCSGALLAVDGNLEESDIVLTAAHCITECSSDENHSCVWTTVAPNTVKVIAGSHTLSQTEKGEQVSKAQAMLHHSGWNHDKDRCNDGAPVTWCFAYDLGMVKLATPLRFTDTVSPIDIPKMDEPVENFEKCVIAGWGFYDWNVDAHGNLDPLDGVPSEELRAANVSVLSNRECSEKWNESELADKFDNFLCIEAQDEEEIGAISCSGDSGGPISCTNRLGYPTLLAVVSGGDPICGGPSPSLCTKVTKYLDWIEEAKQKLSGLIRRRR